MIFHDRARLWHSCRVVQSAEKYFFIKNIIFFLGNKNMPRIVSDTVAGVGALWSGSKPPIFMIFSYNYASKVHLFVVTTVNFH